MRKIFVYAFIWIAWTGCAAGDSQSQGHPCEQAYNCVYDPETDQSACKPGFEWLNPDDPEDYNCAPKKAAPVEDVSCTPTTCEEQNAQCGSMSDGCSLVLDCGECPAGQLCGAMTPYQCGGGEVQPPPDAGGSSDIVEDIVNCVPTNCTAEGAECGAIENGCGETLQCGSCPAGESCGPEEANQCACVPTTCALKGATCGEIPDGCQGTLDCGSCSAGEFCIYLNTCVAVDPDGDDISVLGDGSSFVFHPISPFAVEITRVRIGDMDGDGDLDLVGGSQKDMKVFWYEQLPNDVYAPRMVATETAGLSELDIADLDKDGDLDILASTHKAFTWYKNLGAGSFEAQSLVQMQQLEYARYFAVGDLDNDAHTDIVTTRTSLGSNSQIVWLKNDGSQGFSETTIYTHDTFAFQRLQVVDVNGDAALDVVVSSRDDGQVFWLENSGDGATFTKKMVSSALITPNFVHAADLDKDGDMDVISSTGNQPAHLRWFENDGEENFALKPVVAQGACASKSDCSYGEYCAAGLCDARYDVPWNVQVDDFDGDGDNDLLVAHSRYGIKGFLWLENAGNAVGPGSVDLASTEPHKLSTYSAFSHGAAADLNGNGEWEFVAAATDEEQLTIYMQNGAAKTDPEAPEYLRKNLIDNTQGPFVAADADNDGDQDLFQAAVNDNAVWLWENNGEQVFAGSRIGGGFTPGSGGWNGMGHYNMDTPVSIAAGDLTGNAQIDVVVACAGGGYANRSPAVKNLINQGANGFFQNVYDTTSMVDMERPQKVLMLDFDLDGSLDILVTSDENQTKPDYDGQVMGKIVWINQDYYTYSVHLIAYLNDEWAVSNLVAGDIDGDGDMDLAWTARGEGIESTYDNGMIKWHRNEGNGQFTKVTVATGLYELSGMTLTDLDGDGDLDIVGARSGSTFIHKNNGSGGFYASETLINKNIGLMFALDLNQDGNMDLVAESRWLQHAGDLTFTEHLLGYNQGINGAGDVDGDGDLDLLNHRGWFENIGDNCPGVSNPDQADADGDGVGDTCE